MTNMKPNWDKILTELSVKVRDGIPDLTNEQHLIKLWDVLREQKWNLESRVELIKTLTEKLVPNPNPSPKARKKMVTIGYARTFYQSQGVDADKLSDDEIEKKAKEDNKKKKKSTDDKSGIPNQEVSDIQDKTSDLRDKGEAGAGGKTASQGESRYADAVDNLDYDDFKGQNKEKISEKREEFKSKKLNKKNSDDLKAIGYEEPFSDEAYDYLATREVWADGELKRMEDMEKPNVYSMKDGFGSSPENYKTWMRAAFDGAVATQKLLEESRMDTSKPKKTIQSTTEVDNKVQDDLEKKSKDESLSEEDRNYYKKELESFKKFRKYHDTYVLGEDSNGRTFIVSVSNKKDSNVNDPQNNTTPSARFETIKGDYPPEVIDDVTGTLEDSTDIVNNVARTTTRDVSQAKVDDDFVNVLEVAGPKYVKLMEGRGVKRKRSKSGKPARGSEFGCWLEDNNVSEEEWNKMSTKERVEQSQKYLGDEDYHSETAEPPYDFAKMFIKVGEVEQGGHRQLKKIRAELEKRGQSSSLQSESVQGAGAIKKKEAESVTTAHRNVVDKISEADERDGFPKKDEDGNVVENGERTKAYIGTVMNALHCYSYIDMTDDEDDKMILQMGIRGAKPSHIRNCLGKQSGFDGDSSTPEGKKELKKHLEDKSTIDAESGAVVIKGKNGTTKLADDTWRTAGTSQKVASGFGKDMKDCIKSAVDSDRKK